MDQLDMAQVRSRDRLVTPDGQPRVIRGQLRRRPLRPYLDDQPCYALFEGRAELEANGEPRELTPDLKPLRQVCGESGLKLV